jgi:hypothetical protein
MTIHHSPQRSIGKGFDDCRDSGGKSRTPEEQGVLLHARENSNPQPSDPLSARAIDQRDRPVFGCSEDVGTDCRGSQSKNRNNPRHRVGTGINVLDSGRMGTDIARRLNVLQAEQPAVHFAG